MGEQECDYQLIDGEIYFTANLKFLKDLIANNDLNVKPLDLGSQTWQDGKLTQFACDNCAPLVFPNAQEPLSVTPKTSQMILFPSWLQHEVPEHTCDHNRIMISGNLNVDKENAS